MQFDLDQTAIEAVFDVPDNNGCFTPPQRDYLHALGARRPCVFLAFAPKAAGTFLRQAAIEITGGDLIRVVHAQGGRDAQPYLPTFLAYYHGGICAGPLVAHVHMQALPANVRFLEVFGIRPVVMIRNIPDMLASYWDMLDTEPAARLQGLNGPIPAAWATMAPGDKADFLTDMLAPWYVNFYATWFAWAAAADNPVLLLRFGDFLAAPEQVLERILVHSGMAASAQECSHVMREVWADRAALRFNRGTEGRAAGYFSTAHLAQMERMMSYHPILQGSRAELLGY